MVVCVSAVFYFISFIFYFRHDMPNQSEWPLFYRGLPLLQRLPACEPAALMIKVFQRFDTQSLHFHPLLISAPLSKVSNLLSMTFLCIHNFFGWKHPAEQAKDPGLLCKIILCKTVRLFVLYITFSFLLWPSLQSWRRCLWLPLTFTACLGGTWDQHVRLASSPGPLGLSGDPASTQS